MRSPVSGDEHQAVLELPTGMLTNREHFYSTEIAVADVERAPPAPSPGHDRPAGAGMKGDQS